MSIYDVSLTAIETGLLFLTEEKDPLSSGVGLELLLFETVIVFSLGGTFFSKTMGDWTFNLVPQFMIKKTIKIILNGNFALSYYYLKTKGYVRITGLYSLFMYGYSPLPD